MKRLLQDVRKGMMKWRREGKKGISPIISTAILVAVAIIIAIAIALWATGLVGVFTKYEKLDIMSVWAGRATHTPSDVGLTLVVKNSGTTPLTIDNIYLNGRPIVGGSPYPGWSVNYLEFSSVPGPYGAGSTCTGTASLSGINVRCNPGGVAVFIIELDRPAPDIDAELAIHTVSGKKYPVVVSLP